MGDNDYHMAGLLKSSGARVQRIRELRAFRFVGDTLARLMVAGSIKAIFENE